MAGDSIGALFKDKKVQVGAAVVGGVGLLVLVMRKGSSGGGGGQTMIQPAAGVDSSGMDLYNAVQQLGQGWQQDLRNVSDQLSKLPTSGTGNPPTPATGQSVYVKAGQSLSKYGGIDALQKLNGAFTWPRIGEANANGYRSETNNSGAFDLVFMQDQWVNAPK